MARYLMYTYMLAPANTSLARNVWFRAIHRCLPVRSPLIFRIQIAPGTAP